MSPSDTQDFETPLDFFRFAISEAHRQQLYFGHGTDNAADDMRCLILRSLHLPYDANEQFLNARLTSAEKETLTALLIKRIHDRVPVPYLIHEAWFCGLPFYVDERVLIPRSPMAELINEQFSPWVEPESVSRILDLCTGSACIAIACQYAFPDALTDAVDISEDALAVAAINRKKHGLDDVLNLILSDCWQNIPKTRYDLILSNPPYVGDEEMQDLPREYLHEPDMALRAENNGLAVVEKILQRAHHYLSEQGVLIVEVGNSAEAVMDTWPEIPFTWLEFEHGGQGVFLLTAAELKDVWES